MRQEGKTGDPFRWTPLYLYRELRSEAIRLLLPLIDDTDIDTLVACLYLGLRLRFEDNPAQLIVAPQILPGVMPSLSCHYLALMDAVPGGTGYLKTLYQEKDVHGRDGEASWEFSVAPVIPWKPAAANDSRRDLTRKTRTDATAAFEPTICSTVPSVLAANAESYY